MDGSRDVLESRPHLKRKGENGRQLRYALTYRLNAEDDVVVGTGDKAQEASVGVECQGAPVGRQWEAADLDRMSGGAHLVWRQADRDDLGISEANGGDDHLVERTLLSRHDLCHHFALRHRSMLQHGLTGDVAHRPDVAHGRAALLIDLDGRAVHRQVQLLEPKPGNARAPADGHEITVGSKACLVAIGELDLQRARSIKPARLGPRSEEHTSELQSLRHLVCRLLLEKKKT